jgi:hypothetical protein
MNPKFNLDHFLVQLETDEDMALFELSKKPRQKAGVYRRCPRCGTESWKQLYPDERGKDKCCNECEGIDN